MRISEVLNFLSNVFSIHTDVRVLGFWFSISLLHVWEDVFSEDHFTIFYFHLKIFDLPLLTLSTPPYSEVGECFDGTLLLRLFGKKIVSKNYGMDYGE